MIKEEVNVAEANDSVDATPPIVYLTQPPSPSEHTLAAALGLHDGAVVPFWMFAKVVERLHLAVAWVSKADAVKRWVRRSLIAGVGAAALNLSAIGGYALHRAAAEATAEEHAAGLARVAEIYRMINDEKIDQLRIEVAQLRSALLKISGIDPLRAPAPTPSDSAIFLSPDKFSLNPSPDQGTPCSLVSALLQPPSL